MGTLHHDLKQARLKRHMSIREASRQSGLSVGTIRRIEAGKPAYDHTLSRLCDFYGLSIPEEGVA